MKIHHLNCGSLKAPLMDLHTIVYCLLVETSAGLVLVDTGFGIKDYSKPTLKMRFFLFYMGTPRKNEETAIYQIRALGYQPEDVKHIIQTHMHIDHAGGLADFPWAEVQIYEQEYQSLLKPRGFMEFAYVKDHWRHGPRWVRHQTPVVDWFGFKAVPILETAEADFLFILLPGHTRGHCGVAIGKPGNWLLHAGDAASPFHKGADLHNRGEAAHQLNFISDKMADRILGGHHARLLKLLEEHGDEIKAVSAHDIFSFREYNSHIPNP
jgi:glyoxylase-like metal-dependent hydrolase (beta-lactamase superfamily II)